MAKNHRSRVLLLPVLTFMAAAAALLLICCCFAAALLMLLLPPCALRVLKCRVGSRWKLAPLVVDTCGCRQLLCALLVEGNVEETKNNGDFMLDGADLRPHPANKTGSCNFGGLMNKLAPLARNYSRTFRFVPPGDEARERSGRRRLHAGASGTGEQAVGEETDDVGAAAAHCSSSGLQMSIVR